MSERVIYLVSWKLFLVSPSQADGETSLRSESWHGEHQR